MYLPSFPQERQVLGKIRSRSDTTYTIIGNMKFGNFICLSLLCPSFKDFGVAKFHHRINSLPSKHKKSRIKSWISMCGDGGNRTRVRKTLKQNIYKLIWFLNFHRAYPANRNARCKIYLSFAWIFKSLRFKQHPERVYAHLIRSRIKLKDTDYAKAKLPA